MHTENASKMKKKILTVKQSDNFALSFINSPPDHQSIDLKNKFPATYQNKLKYKR